MKLWIDAQLAPSLATWMAVTFGVDACAVRVVWLTCGNTSNEHLRGLLTTVWPQAAELLVRGDARHDRARVRVASRGVFEIGPPGPVEDQSGEMHQRQPGNRFEMVVECDQLGAALEGVRSDPDVVARNGLPGLA